MEDEDDFLLGLYDDQPVVEEEVREDEDILADLYNPVDLVVGKDDIGFDTFNSAGEGMFDSAEEDLEEELSSMYPHLKFDTPIMDGGYVTDELDVTAPNGEVFRWSMNTDYNAENNKIPNQDRDAYGKKTYKDFIQFANKHKFDEEGNYNQLAGARQTLGQDYLVEDENGNEVELPVTKGMTDKAIAMMQQDPSILNMDQAIKAVVNSEFGEMDVAFEKSIYNENIKQNLEFKGEVKDLYENQKNIDLTLATSDFRYPRPTPDGTSVGYEDETVLALQRLGMPKSVTQLTPDEEKHAGFMAFDEAADWRDETIKNNIREWLNGSQEWGENVNGKKIETEFSRLSMETSKVDQGASTLELEEVKDITLENEEVKKVSKLIQENAKKNDKEISKEEADAEALDQVKKGKANSLLKEKIDKDATELFKVDKKNWRLDDKQWEELYQLRDAAKDDPEARKLFLDKVRELYGNDKINLLRRGDGTFVDKTLDKQVEGVSKRNKELGRELEEFMFYSDDELTNTLNQYNLELKSLGKNILNQGYLETIREGSIPQMLGEVLLRANPISIGKENKGEFDGPSARADFERLKKWVETGEMPYDLTTLPEATGSWNPEKTGRNTLVDKYNRLLEKRSVLLLAKELNVNPTTAAKADSFLGMESLGSVGRFLDAVVESTPEAVGADSFVGDRKTRQLGMDMLEEVYGIERTVDQERLVNSLGTSEKAGDMVPGLFRMGGEIFLTTVLTGGTGTTTSIARNTSVLLGKKLMRAGVNKAIAKNAAGYSRAVMTEYIGLLGSNAMEQQLDFGPGIENPGLFALTASGIRLGGAQMSQKFTDAMLKVAGKEGNEGLLRAMAFVSKEAAANRKAGIKYSKGKPIPNAKGAPTKVSTGEKILGALGRQTTSVTGLAGGSIAGAGIIKTAEELPKVLMGEEDFKTALENISDPDELMALAGGLLTMRGARPDRYVKQAVDNFYTEVDIIRSNRPQWNKLLGSLGMKRTAFGKNSIFEKSQEEFDIEVDKALETKKKEIEDSNLEEGQKIQMIKNLEFSANRLKLKPALDLIAKSYEKTGKGQYSDLEIAAYEIAKGNISAKTLMILQGAGLTSGQTSPYLELLSNGFSEKSAMDMVSASNELYEIGMSKMFGGNFGKNFETYANEYVKQAKLQNAKKELKRKYENNKISEARYEFEKAELDGQIDVSKKAMKDAVEAREVERSEGESADIAKLREDGINIKEMTDAEMKEFIEENGGKFNKTAFGYQGVVNGEPIALVNVDATKREGRSATGIHEVFHFGFESRIGEKAIEARAKELEAEGVDSKEALEQAELESDTYIKDFIEGLRERNLFDVVQKEMTKRPVFDMMVKEGLDIPRSELKEFLNEFIELDKRGTFDLIKTEFEIQESAKQAELELTQAEYDNAMNNPKEFINFVLDGKYKRKNTNKFLAAEQDVLREQNKDKSSEDLQASERKVVDKAPAEYQDITKEVKDDKGKVIKTATVKADQVEAMVNKVANRAWSKLGSKISKDKLASSPLKNRQTWLATAKTDLKLIAEKWDPAGAEFDRYMANTGMQRMQAFSRNLGVAGKDAPTTKRIGEKVGGEEGREFDIADPDAQRAVESAGESRSTEPAETDRQISQFEGKEAKAKQQEILDIYKKELEPGTDISKTIIARKGVSGIPRRKNAAVAGLLFDVDGNRIVDPTKNPTFSKKLINAKGETIPKGSKEKGIGFSDSEFGNIQKYFSDNANLNRFLKTMMKYSFVPNQARINSKGETIDISKDIRGRGLGLPNRFVDYFFETFKDPTGELLSPSGRTKGTKVQLQPGQAKRLKSEFINPTTEVLNKIKKDLLIGEDLANYDRTVHGQFAKGMAAVEALKTSNEALRKSLSTENKQVEADLRAGLGDLQASERMVEALTDVVESIKNGDVINIDKIIANRKVKGKEAKTLKSIPLAQLDKAIKNNTVNDVILKTLIEMDIASPKSKRVIEDLSIKDIATREGETPNEIVNRYIKNAYQKNAKELLSSLGLKEKSSKERGSEANFKKAKPYLLDFIQRSIPEGQSFADLPKAAQNMLMKTLGMGDGTLSTSTKMKDGSWKINGQQHRDKPFTYKEYNLKKGQTVELLKKAFGLKDKDLIGKGKDNSSWVNDFYYPGDWGGKGRNILKIAGMDISFPEMIERFKKNYKGRGQKDVAYETILKANEKALKSLYDNMKDVIVNSKNPRAALEHMLDLQLSQTNRASGGIKGLVGMQSVTTKGERSNINLPKEVHNEHLSELFSMTKDFSLMMDRYIKGEQSIERVNKQLKRMVEDANQALITEKRRAIKDASGAAVRDYMNNLIFLGKDAVSQIPLIEGEFGKVDNMLEFIRDRATSNLIKQIKETPYNKLTEIGVLTKQRVENAKELAKVKKNNIEVAKEATMNASERLTDTEIRNELNKRDKAISLANKVNKKPKKIRVFDFDDTVGTSKNKVFAEKDGKKITLNAEEFAKRGLDLIDKGWEMDFSDFNKVTDGGKGPLFDLMKTMKDAKGKRDIFILTARAPEAAPAIHRFLKEMGIDIPIENITGLGNSTGKAKADWIVGKAAEGYNDFYFADDAPQNVKAVRDALEVIDVKSQVQQARMNASERLSEDFNKILEEKTGIGAEKVFSDIKAEIRGNKARKQRFFIPPSAEDFLGLLYATLPKGKKGETALDFYQKNLFDPYTRATENLSRDRVNLMADFKALKQELDVPKDLRKETKSGFTNEQAVRVYMWGKEGKEVPGLSKTDSKELTEMIEGDAKLKAFADQIFEITKGDGYNTPGKDWAVGTITTDLIEVLNKTKRAKYLEPWKQNVDIIFSKENMNKLEAAYGKKYREAMENILTRMKSGSNRTAGGNRLSNQVLDYINNSTGVTMFFNTRSALLQTISAANFVNWSFNNPLMAGKAFANQPQYWKDFTKLMNSDYLKDRRNGLKLNINESEIADAAKTSKNKAKAALNYILEKGYLPTKFADSFAIASGGAMFYRNRINDLVKKGMSVKEAEAQAMKEFRQVSERSQQSSDPSKISSQQSGDLGRIILQYANTPMQYARIQKRAIQDIANGRGDMKANVSKIIYYGFLQNLMFNALQQGAFALGFGDDFTDKDEEEKTINTINGMLDSSLRGLGLGGVTLGVLKNLGLDIYKRSERPRPEYSDAYYKLLEFSPSIKSKLSRFKSAAYPFDSKKRRAEVFEKGFSLDNPAYESMAKVITAITNVPLDRMYAKINNLKDATADEIDTWQAIANVLGWPTWQLEPKKYNKEKETKKKKQKLIYNNKSKSYEDEDDGMFKGLF